MVIVENEVSVVVAGGGGGGGGREGADAGRWGTRKI